MSLNPFDTTPSEDDDPYHYAGFSQRLLAGIIDIVVFIPFIALSTYNQISIKSLNIELLIVVALMLYKPLMEWKYQATLGKMAMKIKVIAEVGGEMTLAQSFIRSSIFVAFSFVSALISIAVFNSPNFEEVRTLEAMIQVPEFNSYRAAHDSLRFIMIMSVSFVIFDRRHQGVHDKMGRSLVVHS